MARFMVEKFNLPSHWASYFVNGDLSALEGDEQTAADSWWAETFGAREVSCADVSEDHWFAWRHDAAAFSLAGDVAPFTFLIHRR